MGRYLLKIVLALVLLVILAAVSYFQVTDVSAEKELELFRQGYHLMQQKESLYVQAMDDTAAYFKDSLDRLDDYYTCMIDSLNQYYFVKESTLTARQDSIEAENKRKSSQKSAVTASAKKKSPEQTMRDSVKKEYNRRLQELPSDLTAYEKRVVTNEIIVELAGKFKLSPARIKKYID